MHELPEFSYTCHDLSKFFLLFLDMHAAMQSLAENMDAFSSDRFSAPLRYEPLHGGLRASAPVRSGLQAPGVNIMGRRSENNHNLQLHPSMPAAPSSTP